MDLNKAIEFAQLLNAAYSIAPANLANSAGVTTVAGGTTYTVITFGLCERPCDGYEPRPGRRLGLNRADLPGGRDRRRRGRHSRHGRDFGVGPRRRVPPGNLPFFGGGRPHG